MKIMLVDTELQRNTQTEQHTLELPLTRDRPGNSRAEAKAIHKLALLSKLSRTQCGAVETVLKNIDRNNTSIPGV